MPEVSLLPDNYNTSETVRDTFMRKSIGLNIPDKDTVYRNFNRFGKIFPDLEMSSNISYVFFTRPDLNIYTPDGKLNTFLSGDPIFSYFQRENPHILESLSISQLGADHEFIPFLLDRVESFPLTDIILKDYELSQNFTGQRIYYAGNSVESQSGIRVDVSFRDTKDYAITKFFQAWVCYIDGVVRDLYRPNANYIYQKVFDYMCSIYYISCEPDGETINFFHKTTGAFPTNVPVGNYGFNRLGTPDGRINISFCSSFCDYFNPLILRDFNRNACVDSIPLSLDKDRVPIHAPMYDRAQGRNGDIFVGRPFIYPIQKQDGRIIYKLYWCKV